MTDRESAKPDDPDSGAEEVAADKLREAYERQKAKADEAAAKLERAALSEIGLEPGKGLAKAIKHSFEGDIEPDNLDAIKAHIAEEYPEVSLGSAQQPPSQPDEKQDTSEGLKRERDLERASTQTDPNAQQEAIDAADAEGDLMGGIVARVNKQIQDGKLLTEKPGE